MGLDEDFFPTMFAMARASGWLAHWLEQIKDSKLSDRTRSMTDSTAEPTCPSIAGWEESNEVAVPLIIVLNTVTPT
jgi:hypothetical protein